MSADPTLVGQAVHLYGWGLDEQADVLLLPVPPYPCPLTLTTLYIPGLNGQMCLLRPDPDQTYPDQDGVLYRDESGTPLRLHLLGRDWPVLAQLDQCTALEIDADLTGMVLQQATDSVLKALLISHN